MKKILLIALFWVSIQNSSAQGISINTTGAHPDSSAMLDVSDTSKGVLITRMTMAQRDAIVSPANSLLIFQINNDSGFYYYNLPTTTWVKLGQNSANSCLSIIAAPAFTIQSLNYINFNSNTIASFGQILVPLGVTLNEVTILGHFNGGIPGRVKIALYSEDGQTKIFEATSDILSSIPIAPMAITLSQPKLINPGIYYFAFLPIDNTSITCAAYYNNSAIDLFVNQPGKSVLQGSLPVTTNTLPTTINPTAISYTQGRCIVPRFN